jgi:ADP-dependent NAD(P)H-hydrate dehydratase / NAD(P)H-hydrate epimerase
MMRLSSRVPSTQQIRALEASYIKENDANWGQVLMEIAGRGAAQAIFESWSQTMGDVTVFCGRGNNGGDGMVVARYLHLWGVPVTVVMIPAKKSSAGDFEMSTPEANANRKIVERLKIPLTIGSSVPEYNDSSIIVDALLGTGIDREVEGDYRSAIDSINVSGARVVAVDLPSGIHSDSGQIMGTAVRADSTITFAYLKSGLLCGPGADLSGDLAVIDIGLPDVTEQKPNINLSVAELIRQRLPLRPVESNKGTFGTVLTIAGSFGMMGATMLASESALRVGAGLSLLAVPRSLVAQLPPQEVIYRPLPETEAQSISLEALKALEEEFEKASSIILGPGISTQDETVQFVQKFVKEVLSGSKKPCIIDADALNAIAKDKSKLKFRDKHIVLTPHPKELSRLMNTDTKVIQADRVNSAQDAASQFGCVIVLKGSHTVIADPEGNVFINPTGNAGMATAGAGDVLSGVIGGLLAQGLSALDAAVVGVYLHGAAGDVAAEDIAETGLVASDIMHAIPFALANVKRGDRSKFEEALIQHGRAYDVT